jgi:hypothetical protein
LAFWPCYSSSEPYSYGSTGNAAATALQWSMGTVIPNPGGLEINGVIYRYTTVKNPDDPMLVHVQNEDLAGGYIFRETDDWTGLPGNTISKAVPVELSPALSWGDGSIEVEGEGSIENASVVYSYRVDECFNPQSSPTCEGYIDPNPIRVEMFEYDPYNALDDDAVKNALKPTDSSLYEEEEEDESIEDAEEKATKDDFEKGLAAAQNALTLANNISQEAVLRAMNTSVNMNTYYAARINGGTYPDATQLVDNTLPDNGNGLRNGLAQQLLHNQMVEMQYK